MEIPQFLKRHEYIDGLVQERRNSSALAIMVAQSPLATKNWAGSVEFDTGPVRIMKRKILLTFLGD